MRVCNINNIFFKENCIFKVFRESAVTVEPGKSTFNAPTFWDNIESWFDLFGNINSDVMEYFKCIFKSASVSSVSTAYFY